jgi:hypothetical protein
VGSRLHQGGPVPARRVAGEHPGRGGGLAGARGIQGEAAAHARQRVSREWPCTRGEAANVGVTAARRARGGTAASGGHGGRPEEEWVREGCGGNYRLGWGLVCAAGLERELRNGLGQDGL